MSEFCSDDFTVILFDGKEPHLHTLGEILPLRFGL
jgi:cytidine deaminase